MSHIKLIILAIFALSLYSCKDKKSRKELPPPIKVEITTVTCKALYDQINVASQIEALNSAVVQPRVNGFLVATHFDGGDPVKRGDLLFTIDPSTFATTLYAAKAAVESARAEEVLAKRNYERAEPLAQIDAISQSDLDQYRATYKSAVAATKSAEESLRSAQLEIGYTKIYAPISGIASKTEASRGDYIGPGTLQSSLTTISQVDTITVELPISTTKYLRYNNSNSFDNSALLSEIVLTLPDSTRYPYGGEYYYTLKDTPSASSTVVIVAKFPNPELQLKEGMFARVKANIGEQQDRIVVPRTAVSQLQGINSVWVVMPDSTAQWRKVTLGATYGSLWSIEDGLTVGESVVTSGGMKLHNGAKVTTGVIK